MQTKTEGVARSVQDRKELYNVQGTVFSIKKITSINTVTLSFSNPLDV